LPDFKTSLHPARRDLLLALTATLFFGAASGINQSVLNNYLSEVHHLGAEIRGWLEFPRELPGFLIVLVSGFLTIFMRETRMASLAMLMATVGALGLGYLTPGMTMLVVWIILYSLGDHLIFTVDSVIGLKLSRHGAEGHRLGQFGGARNLGQIVGVGLIYIIAKLFGDRFGLFYLIVSGFTLLAGAMYFQLNLGRGEPPAKRLVFKRRYNLFYVISALFGIRKQIFLAFGSWVLVAVNGVPVSTIALLYFIAATLGVVFRPLLGDVIDWLGERTVLAADEVILMLVCLTYAFAADLISAPYHLWALYAAYVFDIVLFALRIARTTYLKKILEDSADLTPTVSAGITIDHAVAMTLPVLSGYIWTAFGYRYVFLLAGAIAVAGFFVCLRIKVKGELSPQEKSEG